MFFAEEREPVGDDIPDELRRPGGPSDYDEGGGTGLEPQPGDDVLGGGTSGGDDDPIGEPGFPDDPDLDPDAEA
jgi:hypothetical protein